MPRDTTQFKEGNPGRPKGTANKFTSAIKERIENVLEELDQTLIADLQRMDPGRRVELWAQLQEYIRPKLSRTAVVGDADNPVRGVVEIRVAGTEAVRPPTTNEKDVRD